MNILRWFGLLLLTTTWAQNPHTLQQWWESADQYNTDLQILERSRMRKEAMYAASRSSYLPKVELLASYNWLSAPMAINTETLRPGVIEAVTNINLDLAGSLYEQLTGQPLPPDLVAGITENSAELVNALYPRDNLRLSERDYFLAGLDFWQPLYLGGTLQRKRDILRLGMDNEQQLSRLKTLDVRKLLAMQYIRLLHVNSLRKSMQRQLEHYEANAHYAKALVEKELFPPHFDGWAQVSLQNHQSRIQELEWAQLNIEAETMELLGANNPMQPKTNDTLRPVTLPVLENATSNPRQVWLEGVLDQSRVAADLPKMERLPQIFAMANYQLYQRDLPVIIPNWMVGLHLRWQIFDGGDRKQHLIASRLAVEEAELRVDQYKRMHETHLANQLRRLEMAQNEWANTQRQLDQARQTRVKIQKRMQEQLASPRDVTEALLLEEKIYSLSLQALMVSNIALVDYLALNDQLDRLPVLLNSQP